MPRAAKKVPKRKYVRKTYKPPRGYSTALRELDKTEQVHAGTDTLRVPEGVKIVAGNREADRSGVCLTPSERNRVLDGDTSNMADRRSYYDERINAANSIELPGVARELLHVWLVATQEIDKLRAEVRLHRNQNHRLMHELGIHRGYLEVLRAINRSPFGEAVTPASDGPF